MFELFVSEGENASIKLNLTGRANASANFKPSFAINLNGVDFENTGAVSLRIFCNEKDGLTLYVRSFTGVAYASIKTIKLDYGWNDISIDIKNVDLSYDGKLYFITDNLLTGDNTARTVELYFNTLACLGKEEL